MIIKKNKMSLMKITGTVIKESDNSLFLSFILTLQSSKKEIGAWFPKSQIAIKKNNDHVKVTVPEWLINKIVRKIEADLRYFN